jgi:hypothetical protein
MNHRGVEFCVEKAPGREGVWVWRFEVDGEVRAGKTQTKLKLMAIRRAQQAIDRELKKLSVPLEGGVGGESLKAKF